ncbi:MAG: hypothetical protein LBD29_08230, partial [Treponema sp.]|nr:hypothetical protein [Treponema sp.]
MKKICIVGFVCFTLIGVFTSCSSTKTAQPSNGFRVKPPRSEAERRDPSKTDAELVAQAIQWGDCGFLYAYIERGSENTNPQLVSQAREAIKRYASTDSEAAAYKTDAMEPQVRKVPKELMDKVFTEPEAALPKVVASLIDGVSDQFLKAKILHDWICDTVAYDPDMYISGRIVDQDYVSVLKKKQAVCSGYTNLYNQMCGLANIESMGINGYSKGPGYTGKIGKDIDHAWNGVKINGRWYLVDVTWDAGPMEKRTFIKRYSTAWLFVDSRSFLY